MEQTPQEVFNYSKSFYLFISEYLANSFIVQITCIMLFVEKKSEFLLEKNPPKTMEGIKLNIMAIIYFSITCITNA